MIYHIALSDAWEAANLSGEYVADSISTEGFIHCSTKEQVERSMNRFFAGRDEVLLLAIDPERLKSELKYEPAHGEDFPHIYGPLNVDAVSAVELVRPDDSGRFHYPAS